MKTVLYRFQPIEGTSEEGFYYGKLRTFSDTKVTEEMCLKNEFGDYYDKNPDAWIFEILKEIEDDIW